jgi:hypothetical protein
MELFMLSAKEGIYAIPFAKSATTCQPSPVGHVHHPITDKATTDDQDNTRYAFLQLDDRVLVYRGADQPDMSVINPESDVWQHIKVSPPLGGRTIDR